MAPIHSTNAVTIYMTSKNDGNVADSFGDAATTRQQLMASIGNPRVACMKTEAGNRIIDLNQPMNAQGSDDWATYITDVLISRLSKPLGLAMMPADCIPLAAWSVKHDLLVLAHSARRNLNTNVIPKLLTYLHEMYEVDPPELTFFVGPSIKQESYAFSTIDPQQQRDKRWAKHISCHNDQYHINVVGFVLDQLAEAGVAKEAIAVSAIDTGGNEAYFSHYRSKHTGEVEGRNLFLMLPKVDS